MAAVERTVRVGLATYVAADGASRFAQEGATVEVHVSDVERFDRLNVLPGDPPQVEPEPKRRGRPPKVKPPED